MSLVTERKKMESISLDRVDEQNILRIARRIRRKYPKGNNRGKCVFASKEICDALDNEGIDASVQHGW